MWKYAVLLSYDGGAYCGWQKQKASPQIHLPSIQSTLEQALGQMTGETSTLVGSGRTDAGVHALGQVAHFVLRAKEWDPLNLLRGLNGILPRDIRVLALQRVAIEFHAQRSAEKKQYSYYYQQGPSALPHFEPLSWWIRKKLDVTVMSAAVESLVGEHDFKAFRASGAKPGSTVRKILEAEVTFDRLPFPLIATDPSFEDSLSPLGLVRLRLIGSGFLKQMVRGIAGTLLQVGEKRRPPECFLEILQSQNRSLVGPTAPARALWLERVWYPDSFELKWQRWLTQERSVD